MSVPIDRSFGRSRDAEDLGSDYDAIQAQAGAAAGVIPAPTEFWPVTAGPQINKNLERNPRSDEIRGTPATPPELPWRARPTFDAVPVPAYFDIVARAFQEVMGGAPSRSGVAPAALTDTFYGLPLRSAYEAPRWHVQLVRDSLIHRASGCVMNHANLDLAADSPDGSLETGLLGLYYQLRPEDEDPGSPTFTLPDRTLRIADVVAYIDGSPTKVPNVIAAGVTYTQDYDPKPYAGRNRVPDEENACQYVHFPAEYKRKASRTVQIRLTLGETDGGEELKQDFARVEKIVLELAECPIATTPAAVRLIRFTAPAVVWTDGGAEALNKTDDINSPFTGTAGWSDADGYDLKCEVVHNTPTLFSA